MHSQVQARDRHPGGQAPEERCSGDPDPSQAVGAGGCAGRMTRRKGCRFRDRQIGPEERRWAFSVDGRFEDQILPIEIKHKRDIIVFDQDEHIRAGLPG